MYGWSFFKRKKLLEALYHFCFGIAGNDQNCFWHSAYHILGNFFVEDNQRSFAGCKQFKCFFRILGSKKCHLMVSRFTYISSSCDLQLQVRRSASNSQSTLAK